jgi:hypothetical protein
VNLSSVGKVSNCLNKWQELTSDPWILQTVLGYRIEFDSHPFQVCRSPSPPGTSVPKAPTIICKVSCILQFIFDLISLPNIFKGLWQIVTKQ